MPAYKDPKTNTWLVKFNYKNWKGETKNTTKRGFKTRHDALMYEAEFKLRLSRNTEMSFESLVKLYRENHFVRVRPSTVSTKYYIIQDKILPFFKNFRLSEIKASDILQWQNTLLSYRNPKTGKPYAQTYLKTVNNEMNALMNFAVKFCDLKENPVKRAGSIGLSNREEMMFWTLEEYQKFSEAIMDDTLHYYCFEVLYWTGIREGELLALTTDDIDLKAKTININKTYQVIDGIEHVGPTKTPGGKRIVSIPDKLCDELKDYLEFSYDWESKDNRVFPASKYTLSHCMKRGCKKAGVKKIRIHDLRHSHISLLISMGFSPVEISKRVGHESITITLRYAHMFPGAQEKMANGLNRLMEANSNV